MKYIRLTILLSFLLSGTAGKADGSDTDGICWSYSHNRSQLGYSSRRLLAGCLTNSFLLPQLTKGHVMICMPAYRSNLFIEVSRDGYHLYNETGLIGGIAKSLTKNFSLAAGIGLKRIRIPETLYSDLLVVGEVSMNCILNEKLRIGTSLNEISGKGEHTINPGMMNMMIMFYPSQGIGVTTGMIKRMHQKAGYFSQFFWEINSTVFSVAVESAPMKYTVGFGWKQKFIKTFVSLNYNPVLGPSPSSAFIWQKD